MENLNIAYSTIKKLIGVIPSYYVQQGDGGYNIFISGDSLFATCRVFIDTDDFKDFENNYKSKCSETASGEDAYILGLIANKVPLTQLRTPDSRLRISAEKTNIARTTIYTHDWTDPTTWYSGAIRIVDEIAVNSGDNRTYILNHKNIIDLMHGKVTNEDFINSSDGYSYKPQVKVNNNIKVIQDPHYRDGYNDGYGVDGYSTYLNDGFDKDYFIQYKEGKITFLQELNPNDEVKITYWYATSSSFTIKPASGKILKIDLAEVQFSSDIAVTDSIVFQPYGYVEVFAPQYSPIPYPAGTKIPLGNPVIYKSMSDFLNDAVRAYPKYDPIGGNGWRAAPESMLVMDWDYVSSTVLNSSQGMEIRISLHHDKPFDGWYASATFYCTVENL